MSPLYANQTIWLQTERRPRGVSHAALKGSHLDDSYVSLEAGQQIPEAALALLAPADIDKLLAAEQISHTKPTAEADVSDDAIPSGRLQQDARLDNAL